MTFSPLSAARQRGDLLTCSTRRPLRLFACAAILFTTLAAGFFWQRAVHRPLGDAPAVPPVDVGSLYLDEVPLEVVTTANWQKVRATTTRQHLVSDSTLWAKMHVEDWDRVARPLRERALSNMLERYRAWVDDPDEWARLRPEDWDNVPQPVRALAFLRMVEVWADRYRVGESHGLDRVLVSDTAKAIALTESWLEHRAVNVNHDGSRDLGVSGASDYARVALSRLHRKGLADFTLSEVDYFDPLLATRALVFWLDLMINEAGGDLDLAVRAYNVGISRARRGAGDDYLRTVRRRRSVYIWRRGDTPAWEHMVTQAGWRNRTWDDESPAAAPLLARLDPRATQTPDHPIGSGEDTAMTATLVP